VGGEQYNATLCNTGKYQHTGIDGEIRENIDDRESVSRASNAKKLVFI